MTTVALHAIKGTAPRRGHGDLSGLKASIAEVGLINPLTVDQDMNLLAGRRRYQAVKELGWGEVEVRVIPVNGDDLKAFAIALAENIHRKDLSEVEESLAIAEFDELMRQVEGEKGRGNTPSLKQYQGSDLSNFDESDGWTQGKTAQALNVSQPTVNRAIQIARAAKDYPELAGWSSGQAILREHRKRTVEAPAWPKGKYRVIYADPPWQYSNTMPNYFHEQADHYATKPLAEIMELPVPGIALDDAVLFLWATSPILEDAFKVIHAWGFAYKASFIWDKMKHNMGHYNSVRHEFLLIATRGSCQPDHLKLFDSVQTVERGEHSAKPEVFRNIIDTLYPLGERIELFATKKVPGWEAFGNGIS